MKLSELEPRFLKITKENSWNSEGVSLRNFLGTSLDDLTLQAGSSSIFLTTAPCKAHFFIRNGEIA